jgi:hypothetical protein
MHLDDIDGFVSVRATAGTCQQKRLLCNPPHAGLERRRPWSVAAASREELQQLRPNFNILFKQKKKNPFPRISSLFLLPPLQKESILNTSTVSQAPASPSLPLPILSPMHATPNLEDKTN